MATADALSNVDPALRSLALLGGADVLFNQTGAAPADLAALGPLMSTVDGGDAGTTDAAATQDPGLPSNLAGLVAPANTASGAQAGVIQTLARPAVAAENAGVLAVHATAENAGHGTEANAPIHGLTAMGEAVGLGHVGADDTAGQPNVATALLATPDNVLAGRNALSSVESVLSAGGTDAGPAAAVFATNVVSGPSIGDGLGTSALTGLANGAVLNFHTVVESAGDTTPLIYPVHGVTALGETLGMGELGGANVLTDGLQAPGTLLAGGDIGGTLGALGTNTGHALSAVGNLAASFGSATPIAESVSLGAVTGLGDSVLGAAGLGTNLMGLVDGLGHTVDLGSNPVSAVGNAAVLGLDGVLANAATGSGLSGPVNALTGLIETTGLGHIGDPNLVTAVLDAPSNILSGGSIKGSLDPVLDNLSPVAHAAGDVVSELGNGTQLGNGLGLGAVTALVNPAVLSLDDTLDGVGSSAGIGGIVHGLTDSGETAGLGHILDAVAGPNLVTDVLAAPGTILGGGSLSGAVDPIVADVGHVATAATGILGDVAGSGIGNGATTEPLTGILGQDGGALGGVLPAGGTGGLDHTVETVTSALGIDPGHAGGLLTPVVAAVTGVASGLQEGTGADGATSTVSDLVGPLTGGLAGIGGEGGATHPLAAVGIGPTGGSPDLVANVLNPAGAATPHGIADVTAVGLSGSGPSPISLTVLSGDQIHLGGSSASGGLDALAGKLLDTAAAAPGEAGAATSIAHVADSVIDIHVGAADPAHHDAAPDLGSTLHGLHI